MPFVTRKSLLTLSILSGVALAAAAGFVWSGIYNIGADDPHWTSTRMLIGRRNIRCLISNSA